MEKTLSRQSLLRSLIVDDIVQSCAVRGLMMKSSPIPSEPEYSHVPLSVFPTPYPLQHYLDALAIQPSMSALVGRLV
jgi:hypothetical protein